MGDENKEKPSKLETAVDTAALVTDGVVYAATGKMPSQIVADAKSVATDIPAKIKNAKDTAALVAEGVIYAATGTTPSGIIADMKAGVENVRTQAKNAKDTAAIVTEGARVIAGGHPNPKDSLAPPPCPTNPALIVPGCKDYSKK